MMHKGEILRKLIKESEFTQIQIAQELGLNKNHFNSMLGKQKVKDDIFSQICKIIGVTPDNVLANYSTNYKERYEKLKEKYLDEKTSWLSKFESLMAENHALKEENLKLRGR